MTTISMTTHNRLLNNMDKRRRLGWAKYFEECNESHTRQVENYESQMETFSEIEVIEAVPQFIKDDMEQMIVKLRLEIECPVCMEIIDAQGGQLEITKCGHKFCKDCIKRVKESESPTCPTCRKTI